MKHTKQYLGFFITYSFCTVIILALVGCNSFFMNVSPTLTLTITPTLTSTFTQTPTFTSTPIPTPLGGGGRLVFDASIAGIYDVYVINTDGSDLINLTNNPAFDGDPVWSPDGKKIAFSSDRTGNFEIYVMNDDGTEVTKLTDTPVDDYGPSWSPDGSIIAFTSGTKSARDIWLISPDGVELSKLTKHASQINSLDWSPDGSSIVYNIGNQNYADLYIIKIDNGEIKNITDDLPYDFWPRWSTNGSKITFVSTRDEVQDSSGRYESYTYVMNSDGSDISRLIASGWGPAAWSPNDTKIAVIGGTDSNLSIYLINFGSKGPMKVLPLPRDFDSARRIDWSLK